MAKRNKPKSSSAPSAAKSKPPAANPTPTSSKSVSSPPAPPEPRPPAIFLYAILALCAVGIYVAAFLVEHKLRLTLDPTYKSSCNLSDVVNCDKVNISEISEIFGLPLSLYAVPTYVVMAYLAFVALQAPGQKEAALRRRGPVALDLAAGLGLLTSILSLFLIGYSTIKIHAYCIYCISLYVVNFAMTALAIQAGPKSIGAAVRNALDHLGKFSDPIKAALAVLLVAGGVSWFAYDSTSSKMEAEYKAKIDQNMAEGPNMSVGPSNGTSQGSGQDSKGSEPARQLPSLADLKTTSHGVKIGGRMTAEDGWNFALFPINDGIDFAYGNKDAKVTVIKVSDYECPYCKFLASTMEPVKEKYKDKVRFIMKQFPMNPSCNRYMEGYDKHPNACNAALTGVCAGRQGKFWEMHDKLYAAQPQLSPEDNRKYAQDLGLDMAKYDACVKDPAVMQLIQNEIEQAHEAGIDGAPRTYINGRMVTGSASTAILDYYIEKTLEHPDVVPTSGTAETQAGPKPDGSHMIQSKTAKGSFWIDPYEASLTKDGKAVSLPDVDPAEASWSEADAACKKAGKRLCSEEEWVSACTGTPAVDNNANNLFADDDVEGMMYPYGAFYEPGLCRDQEDKYKGRAGHTGSMEKCRTPSGIYDLAGNISEWSGATKETAALEGGHMSSGERAACNQRASSFGFGNRNHTTGFRCCADQDVESAKVAATQLATTGGDMLDQPVPPFTVKDTSGTAIDTKSWKGKVTLINFFASWCGPCKKEFPELVKLYDENKAKGFQIVSVGVDREPGKSLTFTKDFQASWSVIEDVESELMGQFNVYSMPATFIVDRQGIVRFMDTGFKPEEQLEKLKNAIAQLVR